MWFNLKLISRNSHIVLKLFRKYRLTEAILSVQVESALITLKFKESACKDQFFTKLSVFKSSYSGSKIFPKEALNPLVFAIAPTSYSSTLMSERRATRFALTLAMKI